MSKDYKTVRNAANDEFVEKRSRFIGYVKPVTTEEEATAFISEIRSRHWDARHNVYAYSLREGNIKRYSDDGEPSGTAGMPMLDVIVKNEIVDVCVVVTRYFGGVLLGTGGIILMQSCLICAVRCNYNQYGKVSSLIMETGGVVDDTVFESDVQLKFHIQPELLAQLNKRLADATAGEIQAEADGEDYFIAETE